MALSKLNFNSLNVTPVAGKGIGFDSGADDLEASFSSGAMIFIKKLTASSSSTLSFVNGSSDVVLDNTYKEYMFIFKDLHPANNGGGFEFQTSTDSGSSYGVTQTSTATETYHSEDGGTAVLNYATSQDKAQSTDFQRLVAGVGSDNDQSCSGTLMLFNPSSTTFVKHWMSDFHEAFHADYATHSMFAGYFNTTSAIDAIQFKFSNGNIDAGTITLYGIN
jgi:hypothetical protein